MATIASVSNDTSVDAVCEIIDRDGAVIIEGMITPGVMDQLVGDLEPWIKRSPFGEAGFSGNRTRRTSALFAKSRHMTEFVLHPLFLGPGCTGPAP